MEKSIFDYLLGAIMNEKTDIADKIQQDLFDNAVDSDMKLKICEAIIKRLKNKDNMSYSQVRNNILLICKVAKDLSDQNDKSTALTILDLLVAEPAITMCYYTIAEKIAEIDKASVEKLLRNQFEVLKEKTTHPSRNILISESKDGVQEREHFRSISVVDFTKLALVWRDLVSTTDSFPVDVVQFSISLIETFWDYNEIGQFFEIMGDSSRALEFYRESESLIEEFYQVWALTHNLWHMKNPDRDYAMEMMLKAIKMATSAEEFTRLAEIAGNASGTLSDKELALELYKKAQKVASFEELKSVQDSLTQMNEDWEFEAEMNKYEERDDNDNKENR